MKNFQINSAIPNTMSHRGLEYLARIASSCSENSQILEAGALYGCTAWVLSKNAPPSAQVYSIDPWDNPRFIDNFRKKYFSAPPFSKTAFESYTSDCENICAVQGYSPDAATSLNLSSLDMVFEDATHDYKLVKKNIEYFLPKLRPGGIICGDDYQLSFTGVIDAVNETADALGVQVESNGQVWALRKPLEDAKPLSVHSRIGNLYSYEIVSELVDTDGRSYRSSPQCWTPNLFRPSKLASLQFYWSKDGCSQTQRDDNLGFEWQIKDDSGNTSQILHPGEKFELNGSSVSGFRLRLVGENEDDLSVGYATSSYSIQNNKLTSSGCSRERINGTWMYPDHENQVLYAFLVSVFDKDLALSRANHGVYKQLGKISEEYLTN